jgi:hypothetical protein
VGRLALALALIAAGAAMFAASARTGDSARNGGIFRYGTTGLSVQIDPQQGYLTSAWWLQYATALKLVNWPDRPDPAGARLVLEAASSVAVSPQQDIHFRHPQGPSLQRRLACHRA